MFNATDWIDVKTIETVRPSQKPDHQYRRTTKLFNCGDIELERGQQVVRIRQQSDGQAMPSRRNKLLRHLRRLLTSNFRLLFIIILSTNYPGTNCDELLRTADQLQPPFELMSDFEDIQSSPSSIDSQLHQQKSFNYLVQQQNQNQNQQPNDLVLSDNNNFEFLPSFQESPSSSGEQRQNSGNDNRNLSFEELLESQSSASNTASASPSVASQDQKAPSSSSSSSSSLPTSASPQANSAANAGILTEQINTLTNLLQNLSPAAAAALSSATQIGSSDQSTASLISGVTNSILDPIRTQTVAMGNMVRKTINNAASSYQHQNHVAQPTAAISVSAKPSVGQSIDGNIEYDPNNNAINGNIEWPSFNSSQKPNLSALRPFILAALKSVPIKLGSVGWKLLQMIAWKKIYKTHHPKSGEIVIEQETSSKSPGHKDHKSSSGGGKTLQLDIGVQPMLKTSKMGQAWPSSSGGGYGGLRGPGGYGQWPMDMPMSSSMIYQRHLMPPSHPAAAAAAAAAATAAAIQQSQWVQNQMLQDVDATAEGDLPSSSTNLSNQKAQNQNQTSISAATQRKRSSPNNGMNSGNWFASPAHAYAAAVAAAATATAVSQQNQNRFGFGSSNPTNGFDSAMSNDGSFLAGLVYQNLFDNAAAMAVQNAVKLPAMAGSSLGAQHQAGPSAEFLDHSDSLLGSSLNLDAASSPSLYADVASLGSDGGQSSGAGWPQASGSSSDYGSATLEQRSDRFQANQQQLAMQMQLIRSNKQLYPYLARQQPFSDSLLALQDASLASSSGQPSLQQQQQPSSLAASSSLPDFDDTPAGLMLDAALSPRLGHNSSSAGADASQFSESTQIRLASLPPVMFG